MAVFGYSKFEVGLVSIASSSQARAIQWTLPEKQKKKRFLPTAVRGS